MSIPLWEECAWSTPNQSENVSSLTESNSDSIFAVNPVINEKIYLHLGPGYKIPCDACIVGQNEQLSDRMEDNAAVFALAGPVVESELQALAPIQTGESVITSGGSLPCEWLIHAVGPRYDERYLTASDHALFSAYKSSLLFATEKNASSIVLTCIYSRKKKFPRFDAAHVVLRTLRKFLQQPVGETIKRVMICVPSQEDYDIYTTLLCAYFPRNIHELESQQNLLPAELGDDWGELVLPDRALKVSVGPQPLTKEGLEEYRRSSWTSKTGEDTEMVGNEGQRKKTGKSIAIITIQGLILARPPLAF